MSLIIATSPPRQSNLRVIFFDLVHGLGLLLIAAGVVAQLPATLLASASVLQLTATGDGPWRLLSQLPGEPRTYAWLGWPMMIVDGLLLGIGYRLLLTDRHIVLFVRRWGASITTDAVTSAVLGLRGRWRGLALDDAQVAALDDAQVAALEDAQVAAGGHGQRRDGATVRRYGRIRRGFPKAMWALIRLALLGTLVAGILRLIGGWSWAALALSISGFVAGEYIVLFVALAPFAVAVGLLSAAASTSDEYRSARINDENDHPVVGRGIFGNALSVVTVESPSWCPVVTRLAAVTDVSLIDISRPDHAVLGDVEHLLAQLGGRCVIVGETDAVRTLNDSVEPDAARLRQLLGETSVYVYGNDRAAIRRFARTLRAALEHHHRRPRPSPRGLAAGS